MKKYKSIILGVILASITACKRDSIVEPDERQQSVQTPFTGVVFRQLKTDSTSLYNYGVHRIIAPGVVDSLLPLHAWIGQSNNIVDSFAVAFQSGDSVAIGAYKQNNEPFIEPQSQNLNFKIRTKVYINGNKVKDTTSIGGQYWWKLP